ncbi:glycoside hydrolase superfamily [Sordaria brevicollis]|uniref:beta-glucosidase n=1 Tax=Sordaria brevicollis TaxID=83679 RepID=A0AAE0PL07_SORBR|nr:glycoside hydrolase superfamily [Sordaria brevicollis]
MKRLTSLYEQLRPPITTTGLPGPGYIAKTQARQVIFYILGAVSLLLCTAALLQSCNPSLLSPAHDIASQTQGQQHEHPSELPYYGLSPPFYPTPIANGSSSVGRSRAYQHALALTSKMTLLELQNLTRGYPGPCVGNTGAVPRLHIPSLCFYDGPSGLRGQELASAFPAGIHLAATWDPILMWRYGMAVGQEYLGKGVHIALGPLAGPLGRVAKGGRNWEGLGSDPYLAGVGMGKIVKGVQGWGVTATAKHFLLNEQEYRRRWGQDAPDGKGHAISANVGDRALREAYVWPFMDALKAGAGAVMCGYNRANHSYACQNSMLLNRVLKTELGFEGFVVSDWDGQMSGAASANAGLDVVMPGAGYWGEKLIEAVNNGSVAEERLKDMATRVLAAYLYAGQDNGQFPPVNVAPGGQVPDPVDVQENHADLIRNIGAAGTVLVKNVKGTLPLTKPKFLAMYGYDAIVKSVPWENPDRYGGGYDVNRGWTTFNGTLITGGGSGSSTPPYVVSPFEALSTRVRADGGMLRWDFHSVNPSQKYLNADPCLVFINAYASEMSDRSALSDSFSDSLVQNIASWCSRTIVVIHSAGIRLVDAWIDHPNVTAVLMAGLPGQESGNSLVDILYGDVNPSGRLPYTIAKQESDYGHLLNPSTGQPNGDPFFPEDNFTEGLHIDYRYFDKNSITPRFEFGYGLSYTTFSYSHLDISFVPSSSSSSRPATRPTRPPWPATAANATIDTTTMANTDRLKLAEFPNPNKPIVQGGHPDLWETLFVVRCSVANSGETYEGWEVAQLYLGIPPEAKEEGNDDDDDETPIRQLRGFNRVGPLRPREGAWAEFKLTRRDLSVWDVRAQQWRLRRGEYKVWVGASSRDLRLSGTIVI